MQLLNSSGQCSLCGAAKKRVVYDSSLDAAIRSPQVALLCRRCDLSPSPLPAPREEA